MKFKKIFIISLVSFLMIPNNMSAEFNWWKNLKKRCQKIKIFNRKKYITKEKAKDLIDNVTQLIAINETLNTELFSRIQSRLNHLENQRLESVGTSFYKSATKKNGYIASILRKMNNTIKTYASMVSSIAIAGTTSYFASKALTYLFENKDIYTRYKPSQIKESKIIGQNEAKNAIKTILKQKQHPKTYEQLQTNTTKRILLYGTHGNGRTILVKHLAKQSNMNLYELNSTSLQSMWVGGSSQRIKKLFSSAQKEKTGCIIYIKNIDTLDEKKDANNQNQYTKDIVSQLCEEAKKEENKNIILIASTNTNPNNMNKELKKAFNQTINIANPKESEIKEMLETELPQNICSDDLNYKNITINNIYSFESIKRVADKAKEIAAEKYIQNTKQTPIADPQKRVEEYEKDTKFMEYVRNYEINTQNLEIITIKDRMLREKILYYKHLKEKKAETSSFYPKDTVLNILFGFVYKKDNTNKKSPRVSKADLENAIEIIRQENMKQARKNIGQF